MEGARGDAHGELGVGELVAMEGVRLPELERAAVREFWERVIEACLAEVAGGPRPTSWLAARSEEQRRERRAARRAAGAVVRELPVRRGVSGPDGREAA